MIPWHSRPEKGALKDPVNSRLRRLRLGRAFLLVAKMLASFWRMILSAANLSSFAPFVQFLIHTLQIGFFQASIIYAFFTDVSAMVTAAAVVNATKTLWSMRAPRPRIRFLDVEGRPYATFPPINQRETDSIPVSRPPEPV